MKQLLKEFCVSILCVMLIVTSVPVSTTASRTTIYVSPLRSVRVTEPAGFSVTRPTTRTSIRQQKTAEPFTGPIQVASAKPQVAETQFRPLPGQTSTLLPDGRWLVLGGSESTGPVRTAWLVDSERGIQARFPIGLTTPRAWHTATLLPDGSVLIAGGLGPDGKTQESSELFRPDTFTFTAIATGLSARAHHTATLLTDGRVVIAGGVSGDGESVDAVELFNFKTQQKTLSEVSIGTRRQDHKARLQRDGNVLLSGGVDPFGERLQYGEDFDPLAKRFHIVDTSRDSSAEAPALSVEASIPGDRETDVAPDTFLALRLSREISVTSANADTVQLTGPDGLVPSHVVAAEQGMLVFVTPKASLQSGTTYTLALRGLHDMAAFLPDTLITFTTIAARDNTQPQTVTANISRVAFDQGTANLPPLKAPPGVTALSGRALTLDGKGLQGVTLRIDNATGRTDGTGRFLLTGVPAGHHEMVIDGRSVQRPGSTYGVYEVGVDLASGQTTLLHYSVWMTPIDTAHAVKIPFPTTREAVVTTPLLPGLEFRLPPNTTITDIDGKVATEISITPIPIAQPPFPLPRGVAVPLYFTIQPGGGYISAVNAGHKDGARLIYPNAFLQPAGTRFDFWNYDPENRGWFIYGHGSVSPDRKSVIPDAGVLLYELTGAMVGGPTPAPSGGGCHGCRAGGGDGDPVDLATGLFVYEKTDLVLPDVIPLTLTRTYRQNDTLSRTFGKGTTHNYDIFLVGDVFPYTYQELVLADGSRVRFDRISDGYNWYDATYQNRSAPGEFYGAKVAWNGSGWTLTKKNGTALRFPETNSSNTIPQKAALLSIQDRNGNKVTLTRDATTGNLTRVDSANGRWITFSYDLNRVTQAQDNIGRTVQYVYDPSGRLSQVTDANLGVWLYGYNAADQMTTITDARNILYLQNEYDSNGKVFRQTQADNSVYQFSYTTDSNGNVVQTDVTDPRNHVRRVQFAPPPVSPNSFVEGGYTASDTLAQGSLQAATSTPRETGTNLITSTTDALGRTTAYTYDALGNITSMTRLSGTPNAVTTKFTYDDTYSNLTSVTDPLGHTARLAYDSKGNLTSITDALGNASRFTYDSAGQLLSTADPNGNVTQMSYANGGLVAITDPLGRTTHQFFDAAGRVLATISPSGDMTLREYNALNLLTTVTDAAGGITSFSYDKNGNALTVTDARNNTTTYTYDNMDRLATRKDALLNIESAQYDGLGNLIQQTDRRNKMTTFQYDDLDRLSFVGYGTQAGPTYESTITTTYDLGSRLRQVSDSSTGTITREYDNLDRLTSETSSRGTVSYAYDGADRRSTMTVAGQPTLTYGYDDANRPISLTQASSVTSFSYDAGGRRSTLTLPSGMTTQYTYDAVSQLTSLTYQLGNTKIGDLQYEYDVAGRRTTTAGTFARTGLPNPLISAGYNANNQVTQWGAPALSYDANGNLTSDGVNTYTWNARNVLASIAGGTSATFQYDSFGRRVTKSVGGSAQSYLYDGVNIVQELNGSNPTANLVNAGLDEIVARTYSGVTSYFLADVIGNTIALTNTAGAVQTQYSYEPFGQTTATGASNTNQRQFTGRESDGTGLYYYRARYYNPQLQRFISEDPIGLAGGINEYEYTYDNPADLIDPLGLQPPTLAPSLFPSTASTAMAGRNCPCKYAGRALDPADYATQGAADNGHPIDFLLNAYYGWPAGHFFDAQPLASGTAQQRAAYGNYVYGVYMEAAGLSLSEALFGANEYAFLKSQYSGRTQMDPNYRSLPAANVGNIMNGFNAQKNGTTCHK